MFIPLSSAITVAVDSTPKFDDFKIVEYKNTEIVATYKNQLLAAYTLNDWRNCAAYSKPGYSDSGGVFSVRCDVLVESAQARANQFCKKFGFDKAAKVNRSWLSQSNPYANYSTFDSQRDSNGNNEFAYSDGNKKALSSFPVVLTVNRFDELVKLDIREMMSSFGSYGFNPYTSKSINYRTDKAVVEALGTTSAIFEKVICATKVK